MEAATFLQATLGGTDNSPRDLWILTYPIVDFEENSNGMVVWMLFYRVYAGEKIDVVTGDDGL